MHHAWTKGLKGTEKDERVKQVLQYRNAFEELEQVIRSHLLKKDADRKYDEGWAHRQIAVNEFNASIEDLLRIMNLNHKDK